MIRSDVSGPNHKVDIWGLGVTVYQLIADGNPYPPIENYRTITQWLQKKDAYLETMIKSKQARDLLSRIFVEQKDRITLEQILDHAWLQESE
jgi:serine/threonine protein kinase